MNTYKLFWSPTGQCIGKVQARTARAAIRKAPMPYRRYLGEIYAEIVERGDRHPDATFAVGPL